ncbi:MAG: glutamate racemase [Gilvibacter sp.]
MNSRGPIGIFDSGIGGTSIWKEIHALLPLEDSLYLADSKHAPYGIKSAEEIIALCKKNTDYLIEKGCKIIVVACNTATTNAITFLRNSYELPFIGIEPAIKPAALQSKTNNIGILATHGTLSSALFNTTQATFASDVNVIEVVGEGLVPLIEAGDINSPALNELLSSYLNPMIAANIDYLVLGCSHYPYLLPVIKKILPSHVKVIDSGLAVARQTKNILEGLDLLNDQGGDDLTFLTNADKTALSAVLEAYKQDITIREEDF